MKKLVSIIILCLGCMGILGAQNVWKPLNCNAYFLGADSEGNLFAMAGYGGLIRSQDEGATWMQVNDYYMCTFMAFSPNGRLFIFPSNQAFIFYSDDHGDTWQQTATHSWSNYSMKGAYAVNNDTLLLWGENHLCYTLDAGATWNDADMSFLGDEYHTIGDVIANEAGDVYVSKWYYSGVDSGIFHSTLSDMQNWTLAAFDGAVVLHMEFDPEGNVVAGSYWGGIAGFQHEPGFYLLQGNQFTIADNGIVYSLRNASNDYQLYMVLSYSGDHGETFYDYGEALPIQQNPPGGEGDGYLWKGRDGHLYFYGHGAYMKSVFNTNDIHYIEGEVVMSEIPYEGNTAVFTDWMAIRTVDHHDYFVTVDGFRPNVWEMDQLIVRYDTIPVSTFIGAFGTIKEMVDDFGNSFDVFDIQETTALYYKAVTAMLDPFNDEVSFQLPKPPYQTYYITINGEKQDWPLVFNGVTYDNSNLQTFIGHFDIMLDPYANQFYGMELQDIQPFIDDTYVIYNGTITTNSGETICLTLPCEEEHILTVMGPPDWINPNTPYHPMHNGQLYRDTFINNDIFREGMHVDVKGILHPYYDIRGWSVTGVELVEMDTDEETTLTGTVEWVPLPYTSYVPVPGLTIAFVANGKTYYLDNEHSYNGQTYDDDGFLVGNDTIYVGQEITATFTSKMLIDNGLNFYYRININEAEVLNEIFPLGSEWYYEIQNENGSITYQYMYQAGDTIVNDEPTQILVKINTLYDKGAHEDVTHEYVYERDGKVYWWNKTLEEFTVLYDFRAEAGDEWEIKVGTEILTMHVDAVEQYEYEGRTYRMLHVSDPGNLFSGDIVYGIGHLTSFFPERLMNNGDGMRVKGLRCYWVEDELVFNPDGEDCDAIYSDIHGIGEDGPSTGSGPLTVYPNPTNGVLFVETFPETSRNGMYVSSETFQETSLQTQTYRITNLMGQTILTGNITDEIHQIDVSALPKGMYFITFAGETRKFVVE